MIGRALRHPGVPAGEGLHPRQRAEGPSVRPDIHPSCCPHARECNPLPNLHHLTPTPTTNHHPSTPQVDQNVRAYLALKAADRWLSVRLELLGAVVVACGAILSVRGASVGALGAGLAGLAITNALGVTGLLNWAVRCLAETEAMMNSVERVWQLVENVESEAPAVLTPPAAEVAKEEGQELEAVHQQVVQGGDLHMPPTSSSSVGDSSGIVTRPVRALGDDALLVKSGWPWKGGVYFRQAVMRYREDTEPILQVRWAFCTCTVFMYV